MIEMLFSVFHTTNELLTAGIAVTGFSLLLYALTFNLRERVTRAYAMMLACVTVVYVGDALSSVAGDPAGVTFWLRLQWLGIIFLPAAYFHASDALMATTGQPSRGRRRMVARLAYLISIAFLAVLPFDLLVGGLVASQPAPYLQPMALAWVFFLYYAALIGWAGVNFWRAFRRASTSTSRRRMFYLMAGATAPAIGSFPYLLVFNPLATAAPLIFWIGVITSNLLVTGLLVMMAYAMAFFGVSWPDRLVKSRLFRWLLRGPVTASTVLAVTTLARRASEPFGQQYTAFATILMVVTILAMQYLITLVAPLLERLLFQSGDNAEIKAFQDLENRFLTTGDLRQFLEAILAAVCDRMQSPAAFIAVLGPDGLEMTVTAGDRARLIEEGVLENALESVPAKENSDMGIQLGELRLMALVDEQAPERSLIGLLGYVDTATAIDAEQGEALGRLRQRAALALRDRRIQQEVMITLRDLAPSTEIIQQLRAAARYNGSSLLTTEDSQLADSKLASFIKDALTHYWGGPKLTDSPLLQLQVVQRAVDDGESPANALRAILRQAIEEVRPIGERRFTGEWILYNILEMKFLEGRKVREVAVRLAMSEADFYRKQRIAIEAVARVVTEMERSLITQEGAVSSGENAVQRYAARQEAAERNAVQSKEV